MTKKDESKKIETRGRKKGVKSTKIPKWKINSSRRISQFKHIERKLTRRERAEAIRRGKMQAKAKM